jgi:cell division protein FtsA
MSSPHIIAGIDIGNATAKVVVAAARQGQPEVVGIGVASSTSALSGGDIVDLPEAVANVRSALSQAATMAGVPVRRAWVAVSGVLMGTQTSRGVVAVARADQEITETDIKRVVDAASVVSLPANRQIIHVIPREYIIDGTEHVRDPLGMKGVRLEADVTLVHGPSRHLRNLEKVIAECGVELCGFVFAPLAASLSSLDKHQKQFGVAHLDAGGGTTSLTVWESGDLLHCAILRLGSRHITNDLAILLRTSLENAERIKVHVGAVGEPKPVKSTLKKTETVDLTEYLEEPFVIARRSLMSAIDARAREVLELVSAELNTCGRDRNLPAGVVVSGGGAKLAGFLTLVRDELGLPTRAHKPMGVEAFDAAMDPSLAVALGLVVWGYQREGGGTSRTSQAVGETTSRILGWLKNFLP